jgi:hypothetical protein
MSNTWFRAPTDHPVADLLGASAAQLTYDLRTAAEGSDLSPTASARHFPDSRRPESRAADDPPGGARLFVVPSHHGKWPCVSSWERRSGQASVALSAHLDKLGRYSAAPPNESDSIPVAHSLPSDTHNLTPTRSIRESRWERPGASGVAVPALAVT